MALPWLIGAAVVGTAAYIMSDSDDSSSTSSNESERREEKRRERIETENLQISDEISDFKYKSEKLLEDKYDAIVMFDYKADLEIAQALIEERRAYIDKDEASQIKILTKSTELENQIESIEEDNTTLINLLQGLEDQYHATKS